MATLSKMQLSGIRSFGPFEEHAQQLQFGTPVTLILGQNGCGKTTIIESLKYACTGELPGGTNNGQGFVNDPKMSKSTSTKGQIKLRFNDAKKNQVTVSRVVELVQTAQSQKFTSKNATIRIVPRDGEVNSISGRCADISAECCQRMNVSPAVLNNVIFCHQENSSWPLDEGKKLKERFDEIFDAQKYNKCSEFYRKHLKDKQGAVKCLDLELKYAEEKKEQAERMNRTLREKQDRVQVFEDDIKSKNEELDTVKKRMDEIFKLEQDLANLQRELATKEATKNGVVEEQNTIKKSLTSEFEGDDEELQSCIESFDKDRRKQETLMESMETRKVEIDQKNKVIVDAIQEAQTQLGTYREQRKQYEQKCAKRNELIEQAKNELNLVNLTDYKDNDGARAAQYELRTELENQEMCLISLIDEKEKEEAELQDIIDKARGNTAGTNQNKLSKENEMKECEKKIEQISAELISLSSSNSILDDLQKRLKGIDTTVLNLNAAFKEDEENAKIENYRSEIQTMERNMEALERDHRILQQNDVTEGKMESEKRSIMEKQKEISRIKMKHSDGFKHLFGGTVPQKNLKDTVLSKQRNADNLMKQLTNDINKTQKEVTTLEVQRTNQIDKIASYEKDLKSNRTKISQACSGRNYNETLNASFQKKENLQRDKGQYNSVRIIYSEFVKKFEKESPCCPVCETDFTKNKGVVQKIIATLKSKVDKVPQQLNKVEAELQKEEAFYGKLQQLKLINDETEILEKEKIPELKQTLDEIQENLKRKTGELNGLKLKLSEPEKIVRICTAVVSDVGSLDQNISDVEKAERTLDGLKQSLVEVASKKSKQEIEAEMDFIKMNMSELRGKLDTVTKNINNHKNRIQQLMEERKEVMDKHVRMKENLQSQPLLETQKVELGDKVESLREEISHLEIELDIQEQELKEAIDNKENINRKNKQAIADFREKITGHTKILEELDKNQMEIDEYLKQEIDAKLQETENQLTECKNKETALQLTKNKILDAISKIKEDLAKEELRLRNLQSNVVLREKKALETQLLSEIQNLKKRIGDHNYRSVYEEKRRLEANREDLEKQINHFLGEKNGLLENINEIREELDKPEYRQAYTNYMSKLYELKITESIITDLNRYVMALEKAILEFHKAKMTQINKTIRHLWRNTYKGNDIDFIEIKTEHATGNTKKRSYNYKVVQVKKGVELDMRGRCSAGQKVLACLIIRMALAETLSSNCGILALDEPTTNLDRANIYSLSDTLTRLINARHREKNFQLLVITHDEEFLNTLTRAQGVDFYYRVERDKEGYSVIRKEDVI